MHAKTHPYNAKSTFREKYLLYFGQHTVADTLQFQGRLGLLGLIFCLLAVILDFGFLSFFGFGDLGLFHWLFSVSLIAVEGFITCHCVL
jgi:hypothetical protein